MMFHLRESDVSNASRFLVVGTSGSGKTTLSKMLAAKKQIQHIELDSLYHQQNWVPTPRAEFLKKISRRMESGAWVADGNYLSIQLFLFQRAQVVIWLDPPLWLVFMRLFMRTSLRLIHRTELWNGNRESIKELFAPNNLFSWAARHHSQYRARYLRVRSFPGCEHLTLVRLRNGEEIAQWLEGMALSNLAHR